MALVALPKACTSPSVVCRAPRSKASAPHVARAVLAEDRWPRTGCLLDLLLRGCSCRAAGDRQGRRSRSRQDSRRHVPHRRLPSASLATWSFTETGDTTADTISLNIVTDGVITFQELIGVAE